MSRLAGVAEAGDRPRGFDRGGNLMRLWLAMALCATAAGAHAQLTGGDRVRFVAGVRATCERGIARQPLLAGLSHRSFGSLCACAGRKVADSADFSAYALGRSPRAPGDLPASVRELIQESLAECLQERGGYIPGQAITPNR